MSETLQNPETIGFQAEARQVLDLMIHSLYSNKEVFLRELISNAADAAEKLRFLALGNEGLYEGDSDLKIWIDVDKNARTLTVRDNGIGMTRQEVVDHIGTIARSGTRKFLESLTGDQAKDSQLIGQFGVGFYSAFIVADRVTLETRKAGVPAEEGVRWESDGRGEYRIATVTRPRRGTAVTLHLREGEDEFLDPVRLRQLIRKFSDHIPIPIVMKKESGAGEEVVNKASALWTRPRDEVRPEEYEEFYKHVAHDFEGPLAWLHSRVEGTSDEYTLLLYLPKRAPFDLWDREPAHGVKLYVRRVFIMEDPKLMPRYLRFVRGIIDSDSLPLNVSREILQENRALERIRAGAVKKVLGLLEDLAKNEPDKYRTFWQQFGTVLKEGIIEDPKNRDRIARLLRFASTRDESGEVSLADYVARMKEGQEKIHYLVAENAQAAKNSPHLEVFRHKDIEVLLLWEPVDEWLVAHLTEFEGKPLQSVAKGELDLGRLADDNEKKAQEVVAQAFQDTLDRIRKALAGRVADVKLSQRLTDSPACLVLDAYGLSRRMESILKASGQLVPGNSKPVLEINPKHPLVERLRDEHESKRFDDLSHLLYDQAVLAEGGQLEDPAAFVRRFNALLQEALGQKQAETGGGEPC
ncbi:molecular chaperone HtpG [Methylomarinovum caldicuralii]|uniref:Chaperone protein HtpG n=1 Tax=Methylomarinovum caldicuralii TaxID=438856 RepID=A0AAU9C1L9_9GAMM|nr:molecular chaperone HtpG [Methylomarinovum caldicuralii]BCX82232.1 molecular chaperone HtpG [Methylomarinovum caldicuralii]